MMILASMPDFVENFADGGTDDPFDPQPLFFFHRRLDSAELNEVLRLDDAEHLDPPFGLARPAGGKAQCDARFGAVVDHHQIGALQLVFPHVLQVLRYTALKCKSSARVSART